MGAAIFLPFILGAALEVAVAAAPTVIATTAAVASTAVTIAESVEQHKKTEALNDELNALQAQEEEQANLDQSLEEVQDKISALNKAEAFHNSLNRETRTSRGINRFHLSQINGRPINLASSEQIRRAIFNMRSAVPVV